MIYLFYPCNLSILSHQQKQISIPLKVKLHTLLFSLPFHKSLISQTLLAEFPSQDSYKIIFNLYCTSDSIRYELCRGINHFSPSRGRETILQTFKSPQPQAPGNKNRMLLAFQLSTFQTPHIDRPRNKAHLCQQACFYLHSKERPN